jgi:hypothetical protein
MDADGPIAALAPTADRAADVNESNRTGSDDHHLSDFFRGTCAVPIRRSFDRDGSVIPIRSLTQGGGARPGAVLQASDLASAGLAFASGLRRASIWVV